MGRKTSGSGVGQGRHRPVHGLGSSLGRVRTLLVSCVFVLQQAGQWTQFLILRKYSLGYGRAAGHCGVSGLTFTSGDAPGRQESCYSELLSLGTGG